MNKVNEQRVTLSPTSDTDVLTDLKLNMHLMKVSSTPDHFQVGFLAAFGTEEIDKIPFYPFPMHFPQFSSQNDKQMLDILISDYTANTLLYYLHKLLFKFNN
ncbi:unnamed protein product [Onchocerca flexuosa]|uniref:Uncharacterized protein n=1 Tax=Onchocerca flexuosa TaxID=387005 RepID=A0A183HRJ4_9BILA|nr:unnamed protein product [Onchocerca flexuosa]